MRKSLKYAFSFFLVLTSLSLATILVRAKPELEKTKIVTSEKNATTVALPDEDESLLNSLLSAIGGFGGGGLLLLFLIRRLVNSYDVNFEKLQQKIEQNEARQAEQATKIITVIEEVQGTTNVLKLEIVKLQSCRERPAITEALTKVKGLETEVKEVRGEVKGIVSHLMQRT